MAVAVDSRPALPGTAALPTGAAASHMARALSWA
jgi:hypothetical protein